MDDCNDQKAMMDDCNDQNNYCDDQNGNSNREARFGGGSIRGGMRVGLMMSNCCAYNKLPINPLCWSVGKVGRMR